MGQDEQVTNEIADPPPTVVINGVRHCQVELCMATMAKSCTCCICRYSQSDDKKYWESK